MSSAAGVAAPIARGQAARGLGPGVRVKRKARHFGEEWAKQTFGRSWATALVHGRIVRAVPERRHERRPRSGARVDRNRVAKNLPASCFVGVRV
jgi:hypothetical protein